MADIGVWISPARDCTWSRADDSSKSGRHTLEICEELMNCRRSRKQSRRTAQRLKWVLFLPALVAPFISSMERAWSQEPVPTPRATTTT